MEFLHAGEALLLRSSQTFLPLVRSTAQQFPHPPRAATAAASWIGRHCRGPGHSLRAFSTTLQRKADGNGESSREQPTHTQSSRPRGPINDNITALLDSFNALKAPPSTAAPSKTSPYSGSSSRSQSWSTGVLAGEMEQAKARMDRSDPVSRILVGMTRKAAQRAEPSQYNISNMFQRPSDFTGPQEKGPVILPRYVGRQVEVRQNRGVDVASAFRMMEIQCHRNSVRQDFSAQRFHERPGLKRKRLKRQRWRIRFKENFKDTVSMVQRMRKMGW